MGPGLFGTAWDWTRSMAFAFVLFLGIRTFGIEAFKIPTGSMENTLLVGDFLLVNKAAYGPVIPGLGVHLPALREPHRTWCATSGAAAEACNWPALVVR